MDAKSRSSGMNEGEGKIRNRRSLRLHPKPASIVSSQTPLSPRLYHDCLDLTEPPNTLRTLDDMSQHSDFHTRIPPRQHRDSEIEIRFSPRLHPNAPSKHQADASSEKILMANLLDNYLNLSTFPGLPIAPNPLLDSKPMHPHNRPQHSDLKRRMSPRLHTSITPTYSTHEEVNGDFDVSLGSTPHFCQNMATEIWRRSSRKLHTNTPNKFKGDAAIEKIPNLHNNCLNPSTLPSLIVAPKTLMDSKPTTSCNLHQHSDLNRRMSPRLHKSISPGCSTHKEVDGGFNESIPHIKQNMATEIGRRFSPRLHSNTPNKTLMDSKPTTSYNLHKHSDLTRRMSPRLHKSIAPGCPTHKEVDGGFNGSIPDIKHNMATEIGRRFSPRLHSNTPNKEQEDVSKESVFQRRLSPRFHPDENKEKVSPLLKSCTLGKRLCGESHLRSDTVAKKNKLQAHPEANTESTQLRSLGSVGDSHVVPLHPSTSGLHTLNKIAQNDGLTLDATSRNFHGKIKETLKIFNTYYLQLVQEEEDRKKQWECEKAKNEISTSKKKQGKQKLKGEPAIFRGDLKALTRMIKNKETLNHEMIIGPVPGIDVGHQFYSRAEMAAVGLHNHWLNGIVYAGSFGSEKRNSKQYTLPIALSVILSGPYEDDLDNLENGIYTGQDGHDVVGSKFQFNDQKLVRGNLALKNSMDQSVPIRVIRGHDNPDSYSGKIYSYDGLYKAVEILSNIGCRGHAVYRYLLKRLPGQPKLTTEQVELVRGFPPKTSCELPGLIHHDITNGQEDICIPVTNVCDDPPLGPTGFTYIKRMEVHESVKLPQAGTGCTCKGNCTNPSICACAKLNGSDFPYVRHRGGGRLHEPKDIVFECGPNCGCGSDCLNRTSQRAIKYHLEVYRTPDKGWAVRSHDFIPSGAPVCEYVGVLSRSDELDNVVENDYIFEIDCLHTMNEIEGRERRFGNLPVAATDVLPKMDEKTLESSPEFSIDAGSRGNVARFINHSCEPNLFVQCILSTHHDVRLARLVLFAADDISPMQELTYDYGYALDSVVGPDGKVEVLPCFCGAADCRKRLH